jgi:hypothetical protein
MKSVVAITTSLLCAALCLPATCAMTTLPSPAAQAQEQGPQERGDVADFQAHSVRGDITGISGNNISVKIDDGEVYTVATGPNTRFRKQRDQIKISDLHVGDTIAAMGDKDPKARTVGAMFVVVIDKQMEEKMRADFGKTWTAGVVQSIDGTNIVIKRPDNVTQTIAVDENTSFRRRREDITLPDIKVGDNVSARGALQNGSFVATELNVGGGRGGNFGGGWAGHRAGSAPDAGSSQPNN